MNTNLASIKKSKKTLTLPKSKQQPSPIYKCLTPVPNSYFDSKYPVLPRVSTIQDITKLKKSLKTPKPDEVSIIEKSKIKALEEIGLFSDWQHSKKIYRDDSENSSSHQTIFITDFMKKTQKIKLAKVAGLSSLYEAKKRGYRNTYFSRENCIKNFLTPGEKLPSFFNTPQNSPRSRKEFEPEIKMRPEQCSEKTMKIDKIIEKCNEAINFRIRN